MENVKIPFFKRIKISIFNFEKYNDFAVEKLSTAIKYYAKLMLIFSIIIATCFTYKFFTIVNNEEELQIVQNQLIETGAEKQVVEQAVTYIKDNSGTQFYVTLGVSMVIYMFCAYLLLGFGDIFIVSILGLIVSKITKMKIKYKSIFAMSIYAFTLSIILNCIYSVVNLLTGFQIQHFQIVYNAIAYIYIVTAILMIKTDFIEQQRELIKIVKEQQKIKNEQREENDKEENNENKENDDKDKKSGNEQDPIQTP